MIRIFFPHSEVNACSNEATPSRANQSRATPSSCALRAPCIAPAKALRKGFPFHILKVERDVYYRRDKLLTEAGSIHLRVLNFLGFDPPTAVVKAACRCYQRSMMR
jgi:hypothetical protein